MTARTFRRGLLFLCFVFTCVEPCRGCGVFNWDLTFFSLFRILDSSKLRPIWLLLKRNFTNWRRAITNLQPLFTSWKPTWLELMMRRRYFIWKSSFVWLLEPIRMLGLFTGNCSWEGQVVQAGTRASAAAGDGATRPHRSGKPQYDSQRRARLQADCNYPCFLNLK